MFHSGEKHVSFQKIITGFVFFVSLVLGAGFFVVPAEAASMYLSSGKKQYAVGETITVNVYLSSADQAANAVEGTVTFPSDKLTITGLSKAGSIMSLWVQEPSYSAGSANFIGVILNPGYKGNAAKVIAMTFKAKAAGDVSLRFNGGSILANDGQGTNILSSLGGLQLTIGDGAPQSEQPVGETRNVPAAPVVTSPDFPDQSDWYNDTAATLNWQLPAGVTGVSYSVTEQANSNPGTRSDGRGITYTAKELDDGTAYFHIRYGNSDGWGPITHYTLNVDTKPPTQPVVELVKDPSGLATGLKAVATDSGSGVDYYLVQIGSGEAKKVKPADIEKVAYPLAGLGDGTQTLSIIAVDKADNKSPAATIQVTFELSPPIFTEYERELKDGDIMVLKGESYPNAFVTIWLQNANTDIQKVTVKTNSLGEFIYVNVERVKVGTYKIWGEVENEYGLRSAASKPIYILVKQSAFWERVLKITYYLTIIIPLLALLILLILLILHTIKKIMYMRKQLRKDVQDVEVILHKAFDLLREDIRAQVRLIERAKSKRDLTKEEERIVKRLKKDLDDAEKIVKDKIDHLEKEIK